MDTDRQSISDTADTSTAKVIQHPTAKVEDSFCLVDPGEYDLGFIACKTYWIFKRAKMAIWFRILTPGPAFGLNVARHYNLKHVNKRGGFKVGPHSCLLREFTTVTGERPSRLDRIPIETRYKPRVVIGEVKTVTHDNEQKKLAAPLQYSVIKKLIGTAAGGSEQ